MRDNFSKQTISEIAKGVGYRCSNPKCTRPTVSANAAQDGTITIGVAAHICAASPGGPRYNSTQTQESRRAVGNGIWFCQNCARLIDADPSHYTVELLNQWKSGAQGHAFRAIVAPGISEQSDEAKRVGSIIAADNISLASSDLKMLFAKVHAAATRDLLSYKRATKWSGNSVELTLTLYDDQNTPPFSISKLPLAVEVASEVTIIAPPGTGKTTTLIQLAGHVLHANSIIPLYFRLGDWSAGSSSLLISLKQRSAFKELGQDDLNRLAERGNVLLLLDGWNELDPVARKRLRVELDHVRYNWPYVRIVATTRRQMLDVPISGPRIAIEPLSEDQEMAIAKAQLGTAGEKIVDDAWRTAGVRELIATPLYLSALLLGGSQGLSPTTKEEVLRLFVEQHEQASDHAESLQTALFGCHPDVLTALASHLNSIGSTTMAEIDARQIVSKTIARLRDQGQISGQPEPLTILELLTSHHTLMRSGANNGAIAFQHQQFQEWYASREVAELMLSCARGDTSARLRMRSAIIDQPAWEESIYFAVERLSGEASGAPAVANAILLALPIDPMLAAEMIYRSAHVVWDIVKSDIITFAHNWHTPGTADRAVRFMIMSGRPEFEPIIWPLASSHDTQIQLPTLRIAPRFRASVLGPDLPRKIQELPEATRVHLLALIASESGLDGMDLATDIAENDPSPKVQTEVLQSLQFRQADRHVARLLAAAHNETWAIVAKRGYTEEIRDPMIASRLLAEREKSLTHATDPLERLRLLLDLPPHYPSRNTSITAAIADKDYPVRDQQGGTTLYFAQERALTATLDGLRRRLEEGLALPFHARDLLNQLEVTDVDPIAAIILDVSNPKWEGNEIAVMAGPKTVEVLIDRYMSRAIALKTIRNNSELSDEYIRLKSRIAATRTPYFLEAILARASSVDPDIISSLARLIYVHGNEDAGKLAISVDQTMKSKFIDILRGWVEAVISSPTGSRSDLNEVSNAIGRFGFRELLPDLKRLLDEEFLRLQKALDSYLEARKRGNTDAMSEASMRYDNQYRAAFISLGGEEVAAVVAEYLSDRKFGYDASLILKAISDKKSNVPEVSFQRKWPRFEEIITARANRAVTLKSQITNSFAIPIFAAIDHLAKPETDNEGQNLAIRLATTALSMPHADQPALVARVLALPQPLKTKRGLLTAIALDGQVLDVDIVMKGIDDWLPARCRARQKKIA